MVSDLFSLKKENKTVNQYETEFYQLLQHAPTSYRDDETLKKTLFIRGFDPFMQCKLEDYDLPTYSAIVDKVCQLETNRQRMQGNWATKGETSKRFPTNKVDKGKVMTKGPIVARGISRSSIALRCWKCSQGHLPGRCK